MKIIQIDGIRGLITAVFIGTCLFAGFVIFPGMVAMNLWNKYLVTSYMFPMLNLLQGVLLWGIVAISYFIVSKKGLAVSFKDAPELSDDELDRIIKTAKFGSNMNIMNKVITKTEKSALNKNDIIKHSNIEKDSSLVSSPISLNKNKTTEKSDDESVSNVK